jgi:hypothetical protein
VAADHLAADDVREPAHLGRQLGRPDPPLMVAGGALALVVCGVSLYLALEHWPDRPRPAIVVWAIAGVVVFYVLVGLAASAAGVEYGLVSIAAGVIPLFAVALLLAMMRSRTAESVVDCETTRAIRTRIRLLVWEWTIRPRWGTPRSLRQLRRARRHPERALGTPGRQPAGYAGA